MADNHPAQIFGYLISNKSCQCNIEGIPYILEDVALYYFGDLNNIISFSKIKLPDVGIIDYVLIRHKLMKAEVEDFILVELQTCLTNESKLLVHQGLNLPNKNQVIQMLNVRMRADLMESLVQFTRHINDR